jgi:hypothetical protein
MFQSDNTGRPSPHCEHRAGPQDDAIIQYFQIVGGKRGTGGGNVDDYLGDSGGGGALGRPQAFHDAISCHTPGGEETAREVAVFGGHPQAAAMTFVEALGNIIEIGHGGDIKPARRNRNHHIGGAEVQPQQNGGLQVFSGQFLAQQILAGDTQIELSGVQVLGDLRSWKKRHFDAIDAAQQPAVAALGAQAIDAEAGP